MAYFLKKTTVKNKLYLSICDSFYNREKKETSHALYKTLGSYDMLIAQGIDDPIIHFQKEVDRLNCEKSAVGNDLPRHKTVLFAGYFIFKAILCKLNVKEYIDLYKLSTDFKFDLYDLLSSLVFARCISPCSKLKTFHDVIPCLYDTYDYSYDQLLDGLGFMGRNYEKLIELFTMQVNSTYGIDTTRTYFDATNFYFEIDREDDFRRKGPSKENRKDPIVGLGLLLDSNQIPIGMKMYPGNESEKPILRSAIDQLKCQNNITGRTIHVADKGLNCAENIAISKKGGDGYLFSKSVKGLPEREKVWVLKKDDLRTMRNKDGSIRYYYKSCIDEFPYDIVHENKKVTINITEKRLLTLNPDLREKKIFEINKMIEKAKRLTLSQSKKDEYGESSKYVNFTDSNGKKATVTINQAAIDKDMAFAGYNLLITSEIKMSDCEMYDIYHNLWRIEESFKIMKSDLDARPVFLQKEETIKGHFLICYIAVLLERLLQFKILKNQFSTQDILGFVKDFRIAKFKTEFINITDGKDIVFDFAKIFSLPLNQYALNERQVKKIFGLSL